MTFAARITGASLDPYYSQVSLMAHMAGPNGSTTFVDTSPVTKTLTANGNASISTAQSKFSGSSGYFDGSGDYLKLNSNIVLTSSDNWTVEFWEYHLTGSNLVIGYQLPGSSSIAYISVGTNPSSNVGAVLGASVASSAAGSAYGTVPANQWNWVALSYSVSSAGIFVYVNGVYNSIVYGTGNFTIEDIGAYKSSYTDLGFNGYLSELRVTKGVARYTGFSALSVPTSPFPDF